MNTRKVVSVRRWKLTEDELASIAVLVRRLRVTQRRDFIEKAISSGNAPRSVDSRDLLMMYGINQLFMKKGLPFRWVQHSRTGLYQIAVVR